MITLSDATLTRYYLSTPSAPLSNLLGDPITFSCESAARVFLTRLEPAGGSWSSIISSLGLASGTAESRSGQDLLAGALLSHRVRVTKAASTSPVRLNGSSFTLIPRNQLHTLDIRAKPVAIRSKRTARYYVAQLNQARGRPEASTARGDEQLCDDLIAGKMMMYELPKGQVLPKPKGETVVEQAAAKAVDLGPHESEEPVVKKSFKFMISS